LLSLFLLSSLPSTISDLEQGIYSTSCVSAVRSTGFLFAVSRTFYRSANHSSYAHVPLSLPEGAEYELVVRDRNTKIVCKHSFEFTLHACLYSIYKFCSRW